MRSIIKLLVKNPLITGSALMIIGGNLASGLNYLYHLMMGKLLNPAEYGELVSLISFISLVSVLPASLNLVVVKFVASFTKDKMVAEFANFFKKKVFVLGSLLALSIILMSPILTQFLNLSSSKNIVLLSLIFIFSIPTIFNRSLLQGMLNFKQIVLSIMGENLIKLIAGVTLVSLGFSVGGALIGFIVSTIVAYFISAPRLESTKSQSDVDIKPLIIYSIPILIQTIAATTLYTVDLLMVKHFFSSFDAGIYASVSNLAKITFFATGPIGSVMFPLISKRYSERKNYMQILLLSILLTTGICALITIFYSFNPNLAISLLYKSDYLVGASLLGYFAVFISLYTVATLITSFYLAIGRTWIVTFPLAAAVFQIFLISYRHDSLINVIWLNIYVSALLLLALSIYFLYDHKSYLSNRSRL